MTKRLRPVKLSSVLLDVEDVTDPDTDEEIAADVVGELLRKLGVCATCWREICVLIVVFAEGDLAVVKAAKVDGEVFRLEITKDDGFLFTFPALDGCIEQR